jgi:hypothetical protein
MLWAESDRIKSHSLRAAFCALFVLGCTTAACFAQEPPLDVPPAGALPATASAGCDAGLAANSSVYSSSSLYSNVSPPASSGAGINTTSDLNAPLYSAPSAGANVPLYGNPLAGDNVPLYSSPNAGSNAPLYSGSSLSTNNSNLSGGYDVGTSVNPVSYDGTPITCRSGIPLGEWLLYPSIRAYSLYSDNLFLAPTSPLNAFGLGATPSVTAQWSNGIHTSTLYASINAQDYPTENPINSVDSQVTFTQNYSPLPDLNFTALGDYTHTTITSSLTSSIPSTIATSVATPTRLPNGNIQLPNGEIVSPTGQVVGNISAPSAGNGISVVNPFDQYTATATASKIFNGADLTVSGSVAQTNYQSEQNPGTTSAFSSFTTKTITEDGAIAIGPLFYVYSNGAFSARSNGEGLDPNSQAYLVKGGIGTRQFGLFRASAYTGYQGSDGDTSGTAGGAMYGASLSYYPSLDWTMTAALDDTINKAPAGGFSNQALSVASPEQIALSSSTNVTHASLQTQYQIGPQWTAIGNFNYTHIDYYGSSRIDNAWQADAQLNYEIWRNLTLAWEYEYTDILSNAPGESAMRNFLMMSAIYRF